MKGKKGKVWVGKLKYYNIKKWILECVYFKIKLLILIFLKKIVD